MRSNVRRLVGLGRSHDAEPFLKNHKRFLSRQNQVFPIPLHTLMQMKSRNVVCSSLNVYPTLCYCPQQPFLFYLSLMYDALEISILSVSTLSNNRSIHM